MRFRKDSTITSWMTEKEVTRSLVRVNRTEIVDIRAAIKYLIKGLSRKDTHEDLVAKLGENAPSFTMVKK